MGPQGAPCARIGLFSTLTGPGSRELVTTIARACADGSLPGIQVAFLFVDREPGEAAVTDASVAAIGAEFGLPVLRCSAVRFRAEERKTARLAAQAGDDEPLWAWREAFYGSVRERLAPTDLDLLLGDMWIWSRRQCAERRGVNLHPALPEGPLGKMWFDVIWDLVEQDARASGVMLHRVTPAVDEGPVVTFCRYSLRGPGLDELWAALPSDPAARAGLIAQERARKRDSDHPLFSALRQAGLAREMPLLLATLAEVGEGRLRLDGDGVRDARDRPIPGGLELTAEVEAWVRRLQPDLEAR
jgi:folate-dependent phosphoribosylglycinamide formyltransferase PurN